MPKRQWLGSKPERCDICNNEIKAIFIDGKTQAGPWGILCPLCHRHHGVGLGTGLGQMYERQADDTWLKTEG